MVEAVAAAVAAAAVIGDDAHRPGCSPLRLALCSYHLNFCRGVLPKTGPSPALSCTTSDAVCQADETPPAKFHALGKLSTREYEELEPAGAGLKIKYSNTNAAGKRTEAVVVAQCDPTAATPFFATPTVEQSKYTFTLKAKAACPTKRPDPTAATCEEVADKDPSATDGTYYLGCNGFNFYAYCYGMEGGAPKEYLTLRDEASTYSRWVIDQGPPVQGVVTRWSKIRINPCTLHVDTLDRTFAKSEGSYVKDGKTYTWHPLANAGNCYDPGDQCGGDSPPTVSEVDLTGTPFVHNSTWEPIGCCPACGSTEFSSGMQKVKISGGGYCGYMSVKGFNIYDYAATRWILSLKLDGRPPPPPPPPSCANLGGTWVDTKCGSPPNPPARVSQRGCTVEATSAGGDWNLARGTVTRTTVSMTSGFTLTGKLKLDQAGLVIEIEWNNGCNWKKASGPGSVVTGNGAPKSPRA